MVSEMHFQNLYYKFLILFFRGVSQEKDGQISSAIVSSVQSKITQVQIGKFRVYCLIKYVQHIVFFSSTLCNSELCVWCRDMFTVFFNLFAYGNNSFVASLGAVLSILIKPLKTKLNALGCGCIYCKDAEVPVMLQYSLFYQQPVLPCRALNKFHGRGKHLTFFNWISQL